MVYSAREGFEVIRHLTNSQVDLISIFIFIDSNGQTFQTDSFISQFKWADSPRQPIYLDRLVSSTITGRWHNNTNSITKSLTQKWFQSHDLDYKTTYTITQLRSGLARRPTQTTC